MIKFNEPFKVSEQTMKAAAHKFRGIVAYRKDADGTCWLMCWHGHYLKELQKFIGPS